MRHLKSTIGPALITALLVAATLGGCDKTATPSAKNSSTATDPPVTATPPPTAPPLAGDQATMSGLPAGHPVIPAASQPPASQPAAGGPDDPTVAEFVGLRGPKPEHWEWFRPSSGMRAANYRVPGDAGPAEVIVFYFGPGMGGTKEANIDRWASQFRSDEGGPVEPVTSETTVDGMPVTLVELAGGYMGMGSTATPGQLFLAAIVDSPQGNVYIRFVGPEATVEADRAAFDALVNGLRKDP